jgi:hypothetical protein
MTCISDPGYLYLMLTVVNIFAWCSPCITNMKFPRRILFSFNLAMFANLLAAIYIHPKIYISVIIIFSVLIAGLLIYSAVGTILALSSVMMALGFSLVALNTFATEWIYQSTGVRLSDNALQFVVLAAALFVLFISYIARRIKIIEIGFDSLVYSFLMVYGLKYLVFLNTQGWPQREWLSALKEITESNPSVHNFTEIETEMILNGPSEICCDDDQLECPVWLNSSNILLFMYLVITRIALIVAIVFRKRFLIKKKKKKCSKSAIEAADEIEVEESDDDEQTGGDVELKETDKLIKTKYPSVHTAPI